MSRSKCLDKLLEVSKTLRRSRNGAAAIEFGLLIVPFIALLGATAEVAYVHVANEALAAAVMTAARQMEIGSVQTNSAVTNATTFINNYLCVSKGPRLIPSSFDCSKLVVDVRSVTSITNAELSDDIYKGKGNVFCPGQPGSIVILRVAYPLPAIMPLNFFTPSVGLVNDVPNQSGWFHILMGAAVFVEEPYGSYTALRGC